VEQPDAYGGMQYGDGDDGDGDGSGSGGEEGGAGGYDDDTGENVMEASYSDDGSPYSRRR
jgi:hypothetical protein